MSSIEVALAVGHGTGPELAAVFKQVVQELGGLYNVKVWFIQSLRTYHSNSSLVAINETEAVTQETLADAEHYRQFGTQVVSLGVRAIFRTSMSAQALYLVRDQPHAVKVELFDLGPSASILLVHDQAQGFYASCNEMNASRDPRQVWGGSPDRRNTIIESVTMAQEWQRSFGVRIQFVQGDTMNRNLLALGVQGHQLIISANEYDGIMQTILLDRFGLGAPESAYEENIYLHPDVQGLSEYQTAHGSADDLTGKGIVNPSATIRAAAALLEQQRYANCRGVRTQVGQALRQLQRAGIVTPDQGGSTATAAFVDSFLHQIVTRSWFSARWPFTRKNLPGRGGLPERLSFPAQQQQPAHSGASNQFQRPNWRRRNHIQGRRPWCVEGTWVAEIADQAQFDPFLKAEFEHYITEFEHLVVVGLFTDVCVDATCTAALHLSDEQVLAFMEAVYGSEVVTLQGLLASSLDASPNMSG
ncbi:hypothetical protein BDW72DRAFT_208394 [Aspergillus terricola var. indicus]